jgi:hypothetical protein
VKKNGRSGLARGAVHSQLGRVPVSLTLILLLVCLTITVFTGWRGQRPPDLVKGPRMAPWRFLMLLFGAISFLLAVHLAALFGLSHPGS